MSKVTIKKGELVTLRSKRKLHPHFISGERVTFERLTNGQAMFSHQKSNTNFIVDVNEFNKTWFVEKVVQNVEAK